MSGTAGVMKDEGRYEIVQALVVIAAFLAVVTTFNIFTSIHDAAEHGQSLPLWQAATSEYTSGIATLLCSWIIYAAVRFAPPQTATWAKLIAVHALASFAFSSLHILLMNAMRVAVYAALHRHYPFGEAGFWYEYRKDLVGYLVWATIFWFFTSRPAPHSAAQAIAEPKPRTVNIQDGKRLMRVAVGEIAAVRAAGNYVEFVLADGRRPLARKSLGDALRELGEVEFVRTHRSWLVNLDHVRGLTSVGAGDYQVELDDHTKVPLSRRFPSALARLRESR